MTALFFIGFNLYGEFGLDHTNNLMELTKCPNLSITKAFSSCCYTIYSDNRFQKLWAAGANERRCLATGGTNKSILTYTPITYFKQNQITIKKVCTNVAGLCTFFISDKGQLYGSGININEYGNYLGISQDTKQESHPTPQLVTALKNVIDAQSSSFYSIALCSSNNEQILTILTNWGRIYTIPNDIMKLLILYTKTTTIYSTTNIAGSGHEEDQIFDNEYGWNEVKIFKQENVNIIKIAISKEHSLFLDDSGLVWSCGEKRDGRLGSNDERDLFIPTRIDYFVENDIKIIDIAVGRAFNLALDVNGKVYSWGDNEDGQCGFATEEDDGEDTIFEPRCIDYFANEIVDCIKCGEDHSYVRTVTGQHFFFGCNEHNECLTFDGEMIVSKPRRIDEILMEKYGIQSIVEVDVGFYNTKIICIPK